MVAMRDDLFLRYDARRIISYTASASLRHIFDLSTRLLDRLHESPGSHFLRPRIGKSSSDGCQSLDGEKTIANLEHLLQCLQQAAFEALVLNVSRSIEADVPGWHQHWKQRRKSSEGWFAEWPNGLPPLSTTWPWNDVRPSLVVLWGVCWMFYDNQFAWMTRKPGNSNGGAGTRHSPPQSSTLPRNNLRKTLTPTRLQAPLQGKVIANDSGADSVADNSFDFRDPAWQSEDLASGGIGGNHWGESSGHAIEHVDRGD